MGSTASDDDAAAVQRPGAAWQVFLAFLKLGLTSFGGPVAHLDYFRTEFVERRRWLDDRSYSDLVALCQFLPGPASSQVGMALGMGRAGWWGALAAWAGFTLPSGLRPDALRLWRCRVPEPGGVGLGAWPQGRRRGGGGAGGVGQAKSLCPDRLRAGLAVMAALLTLPMYTYRSVARPSPAVDLGSDRCRAAKRHTAGS